MTGKKQKLNKGRREFLRGSAAVGAGTAVAVGLSGKAVAAVEVEQSEQPVKEGYRLTKHIMDYYKSASR